MLRIAVITGGHPFDLPTFHKLFRQMEGVDVFIQHLDDFSTSPDEIRDGYDAVVFYTMELKTSNFDDTWFTRDPVPAIERLFERGQGVVALHHTFFAFPDWPFWDEVIGLNNRQSDPDAGFEFHFDVKQSVDVVDPAHPILRGIESFEITDEGYHMPDEDAQGHRLLEVNHPKTMRATAWTREVRDSRVFCFQLGHDGTGWDHPSFQTILKQGIAWSANK